MQSKKKVRKKNIVRQQKYWGDGQRSIAVLSAKYTGGWGPLFAERSHKWYEMKILFWLF